MQCVNQRRCIHRQDAQAGSGACPESRVFWCSMGGPGSAPQPPQVTLSGHTLTFMLRLSSVAVMLHSSAEALRQQGG